jgi:hypothetical protein
MTLASRSLARCSTSAEATTGVKWSEVQLQQVNRLQCLVRDTNSEPIVASRADVQRFALPEDREATR